jgi:hypothetical protein
MAAPAAASILAGCTLCHRLLRLQRSRWRSGTRSERASKRARARARQRERDDVLCILKTAGEQLTADLAGISRAEISQPSRMAKRGAAGDREGERAAAMLASERPPLQGCTDRGRRTSERRIGGIRAS